MYINRIADMRVFIDHANPVGNSRITVFHVAIGQDKALFAKLGEAHARLQQAQVVLDLLARQSKKRTLLPIHLISAHQRARKIRTVPKRANQIRII